MPRVAHSTVKIRATLAESMPMPKTVETKRIVFDEITTSVDIKSYKVLTVRKRVIPFAFGAALRGFYEMRSNRGRSLTASLKRTREGIARL